MYIHKLGGGKQGSKTPYTFLIYFLNKNSIKLCGYFTEITVRGRRGPL